jgi:hypothetical protein
LFAVPHGRKLSGDVWRNVKPPLNYRSFMTTTKRLILLALIAMFCWAVLLSRLAHACEVTPEDWAEVEEEINNG